MPKLHVTSSLSGVLALAVLGSAIVACN